MIYHRCVLCNGTDDEELVDDFAEYKDMPFLPDPSNPMFDICLECFEGIRDVLDDFDSESEEDDEEDYD